MAKKQKADDLIDVNDLSAALKKVISKAFEQGSQEAFSGKSFLKDLNDQMKEYTKEQNTQRFNDAVRKRSLDKQISTQEAEVEILAKVAKQKNNSIIQQLEMNRHTAYQGFLLARMNGDLSKMVEFRKEFGSMGESIKGLQKENDLIEQQVKTRKKQIRQKEEEEKLDEKKEMVKEKIEEVTKSLKSQIGVTQELIDLLKTPEMAKAVFAEQTAEKLHEAYEAMEDFKKEGLSAGQAVQAQFKSLSFMSMLDLSDTKGAMKGFVQEFGSVGGISDEVVDKVGQMAHHFGISGEEAAKLNASMSQMAGESSETAAHSMEQVGHMAELQGIAPGKIMRDMAKNTEAMALYGNKGAEAFGKQAINLHKMGVEISTASKMAQGLLNFEDSINAQMEASVLLGREINFDKARELALAGELDKAAEETLRQLGGEAEWNKMNVLQKQKAAAAAGMTVEEMQKALDAQSEQNKYFGEQSSLLDNIIGKTMEIGGGVMGFAKENAMWMASTLQVLNQMGLGKMKQYAMDVAHWAKEKAHMLWKKVMGGGAADTAKGAVGDYSKLGKDKLKDVAGGAMDKAAAASSKAPKDAGKSTGGLTKSIEKINPGKLLAGAAALILVAAAVFVFAKAAQEFTAVSWGAIGKAIVAMLALVGALALVGLVMSGPAGLLILAGAAAMLILAAALLVLGIAIQQIAKGFEMFVPALLQLAPMAADLLIVGASLAVVGGGLLVLGAAALYAFPGLMLAAIGLGLLIPGLTLVNEIAKTSAIDNLSMSLLTLGAASSSLFAVGAAAMSIGAGLAFMGMAGLTAIPIIGMLIGLATVAPALTGLANALMGGGGGEAEKEDKMDLLIAEVRSLKTEMANITVNLDGKKVGDALRGSMNTSRVR